MTVLLQQCNVTVSVSATDVIQVWVLSTSFMSVKATDVADVCECYLSASAINIVDVC